MGNFLLDSTLQKYDFYHTSSHWQDWEKIPQQKSITFSTIVKNRNNPSCFGEIYPSSQIQNTEKFLKILQFRKDFNQSPIVGIHGVYLHKVQQKDNISLCGQFSEYCIVTQHIAFCFSDLGQISFANGIDVLRNALEGAKLIKQRLNILSFFDESMIFFDNKSRCKIWINQDVNENSSPFKEVQIKQLDCVNSIFGTVQLKIQSSDDFQNYNQIKSFQIIETFEQALDFVNKFSSEPLLLKKNQSFRFSQISDTQSNQPQRNSLLLKRNEKTYLRNENHNHNMKKSLSANKFNKNDSPHLFQVLKKIDSNRNYAFNHLEDYSHLNFQSKPIFEQKISVSKRNNNNFYWKTNQMEMQNVFKNFETNTKIILKKKGVKNNEFVNRFLELRLKVDQVNQKPLSTTSTHKYSFCTRELSTMKDPCMKIQVCENIKFRKKNSQKLNFDSKQNNLHFHYLGMKKECKGSNSSSFINKVNTYSERSRYSECQLMKNQDYNSDKLTQNKVKEDISKFNFSVKSNIIFFLMKNIVIVRI